MNEIKLSETANLPRWSYPLIIALGLGTGLLICQLCSDGCSNPEYLMGNIQQTQEYNMV